MTHHILTLTAGGGAELVEGDEVVWVSADDQSFRDEFPDEMLSESDVEQIWDYLVSEDYLTDDEADTAEVEIESVDDAAAEDERVEDHWPET